MGEVVLLVLMAWFLISIPSGLIIGRFLAFTHEPPLTQQPATSKTHGRPNQP